MRRDVRDMWISTLLLTLVISLPLIFSGFDNLTRYIISLIVDLIIVWYLGTRLARAGVFDKRFQEINTTHLLLLLPLCISFLAIPILFLIDMDGFSLVYTDFFWLYLLEAVLITLIEEMFFRIIIYRILKTKTRLLRILASAGIYALFEIFTIFQTFSIVATLLAMLFAFILGIFLGFIREYVGSIYPCMVFHFLYLFFTETILNVCVISTDATLYLTLVYGLPVLALLYAGIIYLCYFIKKEVRNDVY